MLYYGGPAGQLQDVNGLGVADPYSDTNNVGSSYSNVAAQLIGPVAFKYGGEQSFSSASTVAPVIEPSDSFVPTGKAKIVEYGAIALLVVVLVIAIAREK